MSVNVRVTWTAGGEGKYKNFTFSSDLIEQYVGNWDFKMFVLTINDMTGIENLDCTAQVISNGTVVEA